MDKMDKILACQIGEAINDMPLNYRKAKKIFSNKKVIETNETIKFIAIKKFTTQKAKVKSFYRPISRSIEFDI